MLSAFKRNSYGAVVQRLEYLVVAQKVAGSIPASIAIVNVLDYHKNPIVCEG